MSSYAINAFNAINSPFHATDSKETKNANLYDLSTGASYSFLGDIQAWFTAVGVTLIAQTIFSKILPFAAAPLITTFSEAAIVTSLITAGAVLGKRLFGFEKAEGTGQYFEKGTSQFYAVAGAVLAVFAGIYSGYGPQNLGKMAFSLAWPPIPLSLSQGITQSSHEKAVEEKVKKIHSEYYLHHKEIQKLDSSQSASIFNKMCQHDLAPPVAVIHDAKASLKGYDPQVVLFHRDNRVETDFGKWVKDKLNVAVQKLGFSPIPTVQEAQEMRIDNIVKSFSLHQLEWITLAICQGEKPIEERDFKRLQEHAKTLEKSTPIIDDLKAAGSFSHLKALIG